MGYRFQIMAKETPAVAVPKKNIEIRDALPDTPPATKTEVAVKHVSNHRPFYIWLPICGLAVYGALHAYKAIAQRPIIDDFPAGALWNILWIVVASVLVNNMKPRHFDDIDTTDRTIPWWHVCLDYLTTFLLFVGIWYAITH